MPLLINRKTEINQLKKIFVKKFDRKKHENTKKKLVTENKREFYAKKTFLKSY